MTTRIASLLVLTLAGSLWLGGCGSSTAPSSQNTKGMGGNWIAYDTIYLHSNGYTPVVWQFTIDPTASSCEVVTTGYSTPAHDGSYDAPDGRFATQMLRNNLSADFLTHPYLTWNMPTGTNGSYLWISLTLMPLPDTLATTSYSGTGAMQYRDSTSNTHEPGVYYRPFTLTRQ